MSGHSKWATTKHKKAVIDGRRAKLFAKLIKNIEVAARLGGPDIEGNPTLYDAVQKGRKSSLPSDNIDRAVKRGAGLGEDAVVYSKEGAEILESLYEGYGPSGIALLIECLTDNKNRAAAEVRVAVTRNGGTMADPGSVAYLFARKGQIVIDKSSGVTEDALLDAGLDAGIEDIEEREEQFIITTEPSDMVAVRSALQAAGIDYEAADAEFVPSMSLQVDAASARQVIRLIDALEDCDDVQNVYANFDLTPEVLAELESD